MDAVKAFNAELSALYDVKPPISKAKMNSLTRGAIKAIKFYKHVVQSVEKFIQKCKPEYKVPGLYVIDSIVRQSRHQFGVEKDVFAPRFAKNMQNTFLNLLKCPQEDKSKVIRVLNLWQKNAVFPPEVIQPLFDLADPNHPIHKEQTVNANGTLNTSTASNASNQGAVAKTSPSGMKNASKDAKMFSSAKPIDPVWLAQTKMETTNIVNANKLLGQSNSSQVDASLLDQLQHLQQLLLKKQETANDPKSSVKFDKKLLDFDYGEEEDDDVVVANSPAASGSGQHSNTVMGNSLESLGLLLTNPEVLRQLQTLQETMMGNASSGQIEIDKRDWEEKMRKLQQMKQQEDEFDKHLAQTVPNLPFASECELKPSDILKPSQPNAYGSTGVVQDMTQPPPGYPPALPFSTQLANIRQMNQNQKSPLLDERQDAQEYSGNGARRDSSSVEIVNCESTRSQSRSPDRYRHHSRSRSPRHRDRDRDRDRDRKSRSRSRSRRRRSRSRDRGRDRKREDSREKMSEEEREKERERRKRGLPPVVRDKLSVCSTTLWVGHLSKLVHQEELSDTFGEFGDIVSIDLIPPRGCAFICMNRRQDAYRALTKLKSHKMQGKAITLAWAPGKGVKGKEWKDYWEVELGVSYIPWNKLANVTDHDLELLEEGGMIDEDTLPPNLKGKLKHSGSAADVLQQQLQLQQQALVAAAAAAAVNASANAAGGPLSGLTDGMVGVMQSTSNSQQQSTAQQQMIDTSQPPPIRPPTSAALLPPPNTQLQMMPPAFTMPGVPRMIGPMGLSMAHGLMPNVPIGVPPPNMQSLLGPPGMMQTMLTQSVNSPFGAGVGVGLLTQIPLPAPAAPSDKPNSTGMPHNVPPIGVPPPTTETGMPNLPMLRQPYGVGPGGPLQMQLPQQHHQDDMDVEMEDAMPQNSSVTVSKEKGPGLGELVNSNSEGRTESEQGRDYKERERDRDSRERRDQHRLDRDRLDGNDSRMDRSRDRGRGRDRGRDRRRDGRDRDREDRRDRGSRESRDSNSAGRHTDGAIPPSGNSQDADGAKKDGKPSLADRLRQLADGKLPLDDRIERGMRSARSDRGDGRPDRTFDETRRASDMPISLMDIPKFAGIGQERGDFVRGPDFRAGPQDPRDFPQRDRQNFPPRATSSLGRGPGSIEEFLDPRAQAGLFQEEFEPRLGGGQRSDDFPPRLGPHPPREEFDRPDVRGRGRPVVDDFDRERFEYEIRREGFDPRHPDGFDPRDRPEFEPRRRDFFGGPIDPVFGIPPIMGPRGPRGPIGPDGFGPRGAALSARGPGPLIFHPRGMGPRGMRPGMRPPFGPRGPPFDPREAEAFFRPPFDDLRGPPGPHARQFGPIPPPSLLPPDGPWRNQEAGAVPGGWPSTSQATEAENHLHKQKGIKHQNDRENRNRNRKSRWANVSPQLNEDADESFINAEQEQGSPSSRNKEFQEETELDSAIDRVTDMDMNEEHMSEQNGGGSHCDYQTEERCPPMESETPVECVEGQANEEELNMQHSMPHDMEIPAEEEYPAPVSNEAVPMPEATQAETREGDETMVRSTEEGGLNEEEEPVDS